MATKPLKILMVTAETRPFAHVGGQGAVVFQLCTALNKLGCDARIFMPRFGFINQTDYPLTYIYKGLKVPTGHKSDNKKHLICNVKTYNKKGETPVYFLENMEYYEKRDNVYGYSDDHIRWALLSRGVLEFIKKAGGITDENGKEWIPDVIQSHDWHTGLVSNFLKSSYGDEPIFKNTTGVFTIHNLMFQGQSVSHREESEVKFDDGKSLVPPFFSDRLKNINFLKRGVLFSDLVTTVSPTYSREMMTKEYGEGLEGLLSELKYKIFGVVNGIDYQEYNPETDKALKNNYSKNNFSKRSLNKMALQKEFGLEQKDVPVLAYLGRLDFQKGIDLLVDVLTVLLSDFNVQFVQVGGGAEHYAKKLKGLKELFPEKVAIHPFANFELPRLVFSGADMMLLPSRFEPCGLVQVESMRYGCIPVVRATGGLADTVSDFNPQTKEGTGFVFKDFNKYSFFAQIVRALETYRYKDVWNRLVKNALSADFSWEQSAKKYTELYNRSFDFKRDNKPIVG